jgi:hypothetical protein
VFKLNAAGNALVYSTYLGGSADDGGNGIAVDGAGNAYVTGTTVSTDFPTANPLQATCAGISDAFVTKLNAAGNALVYSTYLGGSRYDVGNGIAVDGAGNAYVTGFTDSTNFPTANALQATFGGGVNGEDAFVAKLNATGHALVYSTYLGGSDDEGNGIAVDGSGNAYITGRTLLSTFPTANSLQATFGGGFADAFVSKLNAAGNALVYSTFLGGSGDEAGKGIAVDGAGNAYVTGFTSSTDFPTTNPLQATSGGGVYGEDAFVAKLNATGNALVYSTYLGGSGDDFGDGIAVDGAGNAYVTGSTDSTDFPTANPLQATCAGVSDAFVTKLNAAGNALVYSTYLGGSDGDGGDGIAVDGAGNAYVTGFTSSTDFPTANPLQATYAGVSDVFVTKVPDPDMDPLMYTTPPDNIEHLLILRRNGANLELLDNGLVVFDGVYAHVPSVSITVSNGLAASLTIDDSNGPIDVPGGIYFDGGTASSTLQMNDQEAPLLAGTTYTITDDTVTRTGDEFTRTTFPIVFSGTTIIHFTNLTSLTINGAGNGNTFDVTTAIVATPVTINAGSGTNTINVSPTAHDLNSVSAPEFLVQGPQLTVHGGTGSNTLNLDDQAYGGNVSYTITNHNVTRSIAARYPLIFPAVASIDYQNVSRLVLNGSGGTDTYDVLSTAAGCATTLNAGNGTNTINVSPTAHDLNAVSNLGPLVHPQLTVDGGTGSNTLNLDDQAYGGDVGYTITDHNAMRSVLTLSPTGQIFHFTASIDYQNVSRLLLNGGGGNDAYAAFSTASGCTTTLNAGSGSDAFNGSYAGDFNGSLALAGFEAAALDIAGNVSGSLLAPTVGTLAAPMDHIAIQGSMQAGSRIKVGHLHTLSVNGNLSGAVDGYGTVTDPSTQFTIGPVTVGGNWGSGGSITAPSIQSINMQPVSVFGGHATETMPAADFQALHLGTLASTGSIVAGRIVSATVSGDMAGQMTISGALGSLNIGGRLSGSVSAATLDSLSVAQDLTGHVTVTESLGGLTVGGNLVGNVTSPIIASAIINGTANDDTFVISPTAVSLNGNVVLSGIYGALTVNGLAGNDRFILAGSMMPVTLLGGADDDTVQFNDGASITGAIDGQDGFDTLDYRAYTTPAGVDLGSGAATGVTAGVQNCENVLGAAVSISVTTTADSGPGSLRQAILAANAHPGHDTITFAIPGSSVHTIAPASPLPDITDPVTIDGYSQPGASPNTLAVGDHAVLLIQLEGSNAGLGANGLHITAGNSTVKGLDITHFMRTGAPTSQGGVAILLDTHGGNVVQGNFIGTDSTGTVAMGNVYGLFLDATSSNNTIGGTAPAARNLISGNADGVYASLNATQDSTGNLIEGNYVGTNAAGTAALPNTEDGIDVISGNTIGGTAPGAGNVIAGNVRFGIGLFGVNDTQGSVVQGNLIGLDATGSYAIGNDWGIFIGQTAFNQIGGTTAAARNVISGNGYGILIDGTYAHDNVVQGNYIGTSAAGTAAVGNFYGIVIQASSNNTIGGAAAGAGNLISGNFSYGIDMFAYFTPTANNLVEGNYIGTNAAHTGPLGNGNTGVLIGQLGYGASNNQIGDTVPGAGNTIAFNGGAGVAVVDATSINNAMRGNSIHDNAGLGIDLGNDGVTANDTGDADSGPNDLQNSPTLQVAGLVAGGTGVVGSLDGLPGRMYLVDFYASAGADPSGFGEGQTYLGSTTVSTDGSGHADFAKLLAAVAPGSVITATATAALSILQWGSTSEFSAAIPLQPLADLDVDATGVIRYTASPGVVNHLTVSLAGGAYIFTDSGERIVVTGVNAGHCMGTGTNTVTCVTGAITAIIAQTADGDDTVQVASPLGGIPVTLDGGSGVNTLTGPNGTNTWQVSGLDQGNLNGNVAFRGFQNLVGGAVGDTFGFTTAGRLEGTLDGAGGVNLLDYSAFTGDITANLALGRATGVTGGLSHLQNVTGSLGNDLLVGDANSNVLRGGTGRNIIIGGAGGDHLFGGRGDNILISGTTSYDTNLTALQALMNEWTRSGYNPHQRADHLTNGTGLNGPYVLNTDPTLGPVTVFDDGLADELNGGDGWSWFFFHRANDIINNRKPGDKREVI